MNPGDVEPILGRWMASQHRAAPEDLLLRVLTQAETMPQQRAIWPSRFQQWPGVGVLTIVIAVAAIGIASAFFVADLSFDPQPGSRADELAASLPTRVRDERLLTHSFAEADVPSWVKAIAARAGVGVAGYAVAYDEGIGPSRAADDNPYVWGGWDAGRNHPLRIHAIAMNAPVEPNALYMAFANSYRIEAAGRIDAQCRVWSVSSRRIEWCFQPMWGEWSSWYAYVTGSTLFLVEGVGDIEGMDQSGLATARLGAIVDQLR